MKIEIEAGDVDALRAFLDSAITFLSGFEWKAVDRWGQVRTERLEPTCEFEREQLRAAERLLADIGGPRR